MLADFLLNIVRQIAIVPTEELEAHIERSADSLSRAHAMGPILDPTAYRNTLYGGGFDAAENHLKMVKHLLSIRKLIDEREAMREEILGKENRT